MMKWGIVRTYRVEGSGRLLSKECQGYIHKALSKVFLIFLSEHGTFCVGWFAIRKIKIISSV